MKKAFSNLNRANQSESACSNLVRAGSSDPPPKALSPAPARSVTAPGSTGSERRRRPRCQISAPLRIRDIDGAKDGRDQISTTLDGSRHGILFASSQSTFALGMIVGVTLPYTKSPGAALAEKRGRVARLKQMLDGRWSVAVAFDASASEHPDRAGRNLLTNTPSIAAERDRQKPLVIAVDRDPSIRESLRTYLTNRGYDVIALRNAAEGHHALDMFWPRLLIAEIEGEDLPGYQLCAYVKATPRLKTVPVMLLTSSAFPSDYARAHSLGAVVCMAKPFRQERLGHIVGLLAPLQQVDDAAKRKACRR
jgi:CheY-like chemotaxis protein